MRKTRKYLRKGNVKAWFEVYRFRSMSTKLMIIAILKDSTGKENQAREREREREREELEKTK